MPLSTMATGVLLLLALGAVLWGSYRLQVPVGTSVGLGTRNIDWHYPCLKYRPYAYMSHTTLLELTLLPSSDIWPSRWRINFNISGNSWWSNSGTFESYACALTRLQISHCKDNQSLEKCVRGTPSSLCITQPCIPSSILFVMSYNSLSEIFKIVLRHSYCCNSFT
jgi:hypothetical protein